MEARFHPLDTAVMLKPFHIEGAIPYQAGVEEIPPYRHSFREGRLDTLS